MDPEDRGRLAKHLERLLAALQIKGVLTNVEVRAIAGSRGMARATELKHMGYPITTRKLTGGLGGSPRAVAAVETAIADKVAAPRDEREPKKL